ncbi:Mu transposase C-terminal domain-containing protein [Roseateles sp.]|uniref:Mu transposase C-terminal domain-containing protein n=1 Tax=Roseateles sp. TaxID=1971397 RepID=UPI0032665749
MNPRSINRWTPCPSMRNRLDKAMFDVRLPQPAREYVEACMANGPSRDVQGRYGNNTFTFYSHKTQATLKLESRRGEHVMAVLLDRDTKVIAFFAQPPQVSLDYLDEQGKRTTTRMYTPDFLVVREDKVLVIETRATEALLEANKANPYQFYRDLDGVWHFRAAEEHFKRIGIEYELKANSDLPAVLVGNMRFLEDYSHSSCPALTEAEIEAVQKPVVARRFVPMLELLGSGVSADHIFKAIVERHVYVDLESDNLAAIDDVGLYADEETCKVYRAVAGKAFEPPPPIPGSLFLRSGSPISIYGCEYTVLLEGEGDVCLVDQFGQQQFKSRREIELLYEQGHAAGEAVRLSTDPKDLASIPSAKLEMARERLEAVNSGSTAKYSKRSLARFRSRIAGAATLLDQLIALVDKEAEKGNRSERISKVNLNLIEKAIEEGYNTPTQQRKSGAYAKYRGLCEGLDDASVAAVAGPKREESGAPVQPVSYQTFCRYCTDHYDVVKREGRRAAYQRRTIVPRLDNRYPTHGTHPHDVCEIDHTVANLVLKSTTGLEFTTKPTLTIGVDGHTAHARALVMSFDPPSAKTVLLVLRDYVRRHHRLPRTLIVDNGKEFHSHELEFFCRMFGIEIRFRSPGEPRGAAMIERLLGAVETEVLSEMEGNTRIMKENTRQVTKSVDPWRHVRWDLYSAYKAVEQYLFEVRAQRVHPAHGQSPDDFEAASRRATGQREFRMFKLDENMMLMTCPHAKRPQRKVIRGRGVNVNGIYYRHEALDRVKRNASVEVRVEPFNASVVYVNVGDRWVAAVGTSSRWLGKRTYREVEIARREEQRIKQLNAKRDGVSSASLKHQMRPLRPEDFDPAVAAQQAAIRALNESLGMATAFPVPAGLLDEAAANDAPTPLANAAPGARPAPQPTALDGVRPQLPQASAPLNSEPPANDDDFEDRLGALCNLQ